MNIGIFTDTYYPQLNGVVTSTRMLEKELIKLGHNVYIFTTTDPNIKQKESNVFRIPSMPFVFSPTNRFGLVYPPRTLLKLRVLKLDIVHTQTEFSLGILGKMVSKVLKLPQVHTYHTMYEDYVHYIANGALITPAMAKTYSRVFCNSAKAIVAPVDKARESLLEYGVERPIRTIPTGIDFEPFERERYPETEIEAIKKALNIPVDAPAIVSVGRIAKEKSIDVILKQMPALINKIPGIKFIIVGDGPLKNELEQTAATLGVASSVIFAGARPWSEIGKYYRLGDVFVNASTSETQGLTYIEAMAAKVPVIAKRDKSVKDIIIDNVTGYYFENENALPDLIQRVLADRQERIQTAERAYKSIGHMSAQNFALEIERLYKDLLRAYPKPVKKRKLILNKSINNN